MQVVYVANEDNLEATLLDAYLNREESQITIGKTKMVMPVIVNVSLTDFKALREILGVSFYRYVGDLRKVKTPTQVAIDMFTMKIKRMVQIAKTSDVDLLVIYESTENIDIVRDELKKWIRQ